VTRVKMDDTFKKTTKRESDEWTKNINYT
jgi:hypothetical protein